ncbi:MAG: hypothetical protein WBA93_20945 [Microcoleaceae cyanobacterium]
MQQCKKCNSEKLIPHVRIIDKGHYNTELSLEVEVCEKPGGLPLFKKSHRGTLEATICGECGHTELTVTNVEELYQAYLKASQSGS